MTAIIMSLYFLQHSDKEVVIQDESFLFGKFHHTTILVTYSRLFPCLLMPLRRTLLSCLLQHFPLKLYSPWITFSFLPLLWEGRSGAVSETFGLNSSTCSYHTNRKSRLINLDFDSPSSEGTRGRAKRKQWPKEDGFCSDSPVATETPWKTKRRSAQALP